MTTTTASPYQSRYGFTQSTADNGRSGDATRMLSVIDYTDASTFYTSDRDLSTDGTSPVDLLLGMLESTPSESNDDTIEHVLVNIRDNRKNTALRYREQIASVGVETVGGAYVAAGVEIPEEFMGYIESGTSSPETIDAVTNFFRRLALNPSVEAKADLFRWILANPSLSLTGDGLVVGYRGLRADMTSVMSGYGEIQRPGSDEIEYVAQNNLDNNIGNIVSMPRVMVDHDPDNGCSFGLHIGTWEYASTWGDRNTTTIALVDPADVVVVPSSESDKMRVCRYRVVALVDKPLAEYDFIYNPEGGN